MDQVSDHVSQIRSNLIIPVDMWRLYAGESAIPRRNAEGMAQASSNGGAESQS